MKAFSRFHLKFLRFYYHLIWVQQDQSAYYHLSHFPNQTDYLPFLIDDYFKRPYRNPTELHLPYFDMITFENHLVLKKCEMSDSWPYMNTNLDFDNYITLNDPITQTIDQSQCIIGNPMDQQNNPNQKKK